MGLQRLDIPARIAERALGPLDQFKTGLKKRLLFNLTQQVWVRLDRSVGLQ